MLKNSLKIRGQKNRISSHLLSQVTFSSRTCIREDLGLLYLHSIFKVESL